ncbi:DUF368 domain-containing protein [Candidatus Woesearchaeota archaeon]|jgi:putative membrane protein|nr:DUF368 domain-containing protein [Candidatus Woesearchaeota archaeon]MBT5739528.1 DUF368 domain-containing protein [Candidatus Woesearchaeota archaeon]
MQIKEPLLLFLKGIFMGIADLIPGVSGGTIAFITNIYQKLIHSIKEVIASIPLFLKLQWKPAFKKINFSFLVPLFLGIIIAFLTLSKVITILLTQFSGETFAFFFGLILASGIYLYTHIKKVKFEHFIVFIIGLTISYSISGLGAISATPPLWFIFIGGVIAISALLLPGISGSFILLLMGQYQYILTAIHELNLKVIITFAAGALVGLTLFTKVVDYLLKKWKALTLAFLIGIMLGSLRIPWAKMIDSQTSVGVLIVLGIFGFALVFLLERLGKH